MTPDNLVAAVARAICCRNGCDAAGMVYDPCRGGVSICQSHTYRDDAKAAILATLEGIREATPEMIEAASAAPDRGDYAEIVAGEWTAMIDHLAASMKDPEHG